jgi:hypothetical protein
MGDDPAQDGFLSPSQTEQGEFSEEESQEDATSELDLSTNPQLRAYVEMGLQAALHGLWEVIL